MHLYKSVLGCLHTAHGVSHFIRRSIGIKQGCPMSPTLFRIYIDELESFLHEHIEYKDRFSLHQVLISILLFVNDVILLASSPNGLQRQWDALALFWDFQQLIDSLGKTKVMIFNRSKKVISDYHFLFKGVEIKINSIYTCLRVQFSGLYFNLKHARQP